MTHALVPLHVSLAGRSVAVIGGGPVGWRKATTALEGGAHVRVIAPYVCGELADAAAAGEVDWERRVYLAGDLSGAWLAFAATGDAETDLAVEREAESARIFCVRASRPEPGRPTGSRSPAVLRRGSVTVSVGTDGGADPRRALAIRDAIGWVIDSGRLPLRRRRPGPGRVTIVAGGPGAGDLITLRGRRVLDEADVVVVDRLAPREVLAGLGSDVLVLEVGSSAGHHFDSQTQVNQLLIEHARAGRQVVRLQGGDSFVIERVAEEAIACRAAGVEVSVVPGVSSALAATAGIP